MFFGKPTREIEKKIGVRMSIPLMLLSVLALFGGLLKIPLYTVFPAFSEQLYRQSTALVSFITLAMPILGLATAVLFYLTGTFSAAHFVNSYWLRLISRLFLTGWGLDAIYGAVLIRPYKILAILNKNDVVDKMYLGIAWLSRQMHHLTSVTQTGSIRWYASSMAFGTVVVIAIGLLS